MCGLVRVKVLNYPKVWVDRLGFKTEVTDYWARRCLIPIGTIRHPLEYKLLASGYRDIPIEDVVTIPFDRASLGFTSRKLLNILLLGGSGDGKTLMIKNVLSVLSRADYYNIYYEPKGTFDGVRAKEKWFHDRLAPLMKPEGLKIKSLYPGWGHEKIKFNPCMDKEAYSYSLSDFDSWEYWMSLGHSKMGAFKIHKICSELDSEGLLSLDNVEVKMDALSLGANPEMAMQTYNKSKGIMNDIRYFNVLSDVVPVLEPLDWLRRGYILLVNFPNKFNQHLMCFDIGVMIRKMVKLSVKGLLNGHPVMFYFDDSSFYANKIEGVLFNMALSDIMDIGNNYRSLGLNNLLAVQTLSIIDEDVAETYKTKLISPLFANPDSLRKINIPERVISYLKENVLVKDSLHYAFQWVKIDQYNNVELFFPFPPGCKHFADEVEV